MLGLCMDVLVQCCMVNVLALPRPRYGLLNRRWLCPGSVDVQRQVVSYSCCLTNLTIHKAGPLVLFCDHEQLHEQLMFRLRNLAVRLHRQI